MTFVLDWPCEAELHMSGLHVRPESDAFAWLQEGVRTSPASEEEQHKVLAVCLPTAHLARV